MIERVELKGLGAHGFGRWLQNWKDLHRSGEWEVTVLIALDNSHAVAMACQRHQTLTSTKGAIPGAIT
jgi:hypothetical protein